MLSLEGRQLGNYTVTRRIRSGGMGAVYEGRQRTAFDRRVAIKVILGTYATDPDMRRRFAREAKTVARLHHPHILPLIEFGDEQGVLYLVMPFIEGGTLTGYLRRHLPDVHEVSIIFLQLLEAVEYAHDEGLIHRDIKSSNVLLESRRNGPPYAYLADFGLVRTIQQAELESSYAGTPIPLDQVPGTPQYMAPEQTLGIVTPSTDIYALGVLLYQMLTGELPYNDPDDIEVIKMQLHAPVPNPSDTDASVPTELGAVVARAMAKRAEQRFANVSEFREALLTALNRPVERIEDLSFEDEDEFAVHELPRHQAPPSRPVRSPRAASQQLRMPPEPIEFVEPPLPPAGALHRVTDDHHESLPPAGMRRRITGDQYEPPLSASAHRQRTTDEQNKLPPLSASARRRNTGEGNEIAHPGGRRSHVATGGLGKMASIAIPQLGPQSARSSAVLARPHAAPGAQPRKQSRHLTFMLGIGLIMAVLLILLLLLPRVFGLSIFPAGFPLFGASPVAKISLTVKTSNVRDTFLLTASPQITQPDANTRVMPDRSATGKASEQRTVATSGLKSSGGSRASGILHFDNSSHEAVRISSGFTFTANNGVQVVLENTIVVPPHVGGLDGMADAPAMAVEPGRVGNIAPNTLNSPCCGGPVLVSNPAAFNGGNDAGVTHLIAQNDLDGVKNELTSELHQQATQQLTNQLQPDEAQAGTPVYTISVTSNLPVGAVADHVTVTVTVTAASFIYNTHTASNLARQLLSSEVRKSLSLGPNYQLRGNLTIATPTIEQQGTNGQIYLSVSASGLWVYTVTAQAEEQWRLAVKGASLPLAQNYLATRAGITNVHIDLPFGTDHLPTDETLIVFAIL